MACSITSLINLINKTNDLHFSKLLMKRNYSISTHKSIHMDQIVNLHITLGLQQHYILLWPLWILPLQKESFHHSMVPFHCQSHVQLNHQTTFMPAFIHYHYYHILFATNLQERWGCAAQVLENSMKSQETSTVDHVVLYTDGIAYISFIYKSWPSQPLVQPHKTRRKSLRYRTNSVLDRPGRKSNATRAKIQRTAVPGKTFMDSNSTFRIL